jgi:hypothetical protein
VVVALVAEALAVETWQVELEVLHRFHNPLEQENNEIYNQFY